MDFCEERNCSKCCLRPNIHLIATDVNNITANGFYDVYFVNEDNGIKTIRTNDDGSCIFFKKDIGQCEIFKTKPEMCTLRPYIISDHQNEPDVDNECKFSSDFKSNNDEKEQLEKFHEKLKHEIEWRKETGYF